MKLLMHFPVGQQIWRSLLAMLFLSLATATVSAQTYYTNLHNFTGASDGEYPEAGLVLSGSSLYGTALFGGSSGNGTVFKVNVDGSGFTNLHNFIGSTDGLTPRGKLILSGNTLYGTANGGGSSGKGTVFSVKTDGSGFTNLHSFTGNDGDAPIAGLILSDNTLYGTTQYGGSSGAGTVFKVNTNGSGFTNLYSFTGGSDGSTLWGGLILSGNTLYGTALEGGSSISGGGTVFKVNIDGTGFTNLHTFADSTGSDGEAPQAGLILLGNTLYGTTERGGILNIGTVFKVNTDGSGFTNLYSFTGGSNGANPAGDLIISGDTLYGTAQYGGSSGAGTMFTVNTKGSGFTTLYSFTGYNGAYPHGVLILSGHILYGTANFGGSSGKGTVFSLSLPPQLTIIRSASNIVLAWPTNAFGFTLQSTTNLPSTDWLPVPESPSVVDDQFCVTNSPVGDTLFYRLRGN